MTWGPWIKHDGRGCPVPVGTKAMLRFESEPGEFVDVCQRVRGRQSWFWSWWMKRNPETGARFARVVAYRLPGSEAVDRLRDIAALRLPTGIEGGRHDIRRQKETVR